MIYETYRGKKIFVILRNGRRYAGKVKNIEKSEGKTYFILIDNKNRLVTFPANKIETIQEEK